jgi:hypothetical protein
MRGHIGLHLPRDYFMTTVVTLTDSEFDRLEKNYSFENVNNYTGLKWQMQ